MSKGKSETKRDDEKFWVLLARIAVGEMSTLDLTTNGLLQLASESGAALFVPGGFVRIDCCTSYIRGRRTRKYYRYFSITTPFFVCEISLPRFVASFRNVTSDEYSTS